MVVLFDCSVLTDTEKRIVSVLSDGHIHTCEEIALLLGDAYIDKNNVKVHICNIRKKLSNAGILVNFVHGNKVRGYQMSRRLTKE